MFHMKYQNKKRTKNIGESERKFLLRDEDIYIYIYINLI